MREKRNVISQIRYLFTGIFLLFLAVRAHAYDRTIEEAVGIYNHLQGNKLCHIFPIGMEIEQGGIDDETVTLTSINNSLSCKPTGQLRIQIQKPKSGKTYRVKLTKFPAGYTGDTEFLIDESKKVGGISFVVETAYVMPPGAYEVKLLDTTNPINLLPVPAIINTLPRDFPATNRSNDDFGKDQVYMDIKNGGKADCAYMDVRYSKNTNSPFYKYFTTPELRDLYEYTAYSDDDFNQIYGGNPNHPSIQWRPLFDVPAGRTVFTDVIYYDLQAHGRKYKDLKTSTGRPKFYFRIKGTNCQSSMDAGDMRFMGANISFLGTCQAPEMTLTAGGSLVCLPISYEIRQGGVKVKEGQFTQAGQEKITVLDGGRYFDPNQEYEVTFTSADGQTEIRKDKFSDFYRTVKPDGGYIEQDRCFGSLEPPKGMIRTYFRRNMGGTQFSMNGFKVTLLQAPAAYRDEPGKLKLNQTVTIAYRNPNSVITNIMATQNQDDLEQYFTLPEGIYKIKVEDLCGNVTYLYSRYSVDEFKLQYPSYKEKELTPEVEAECTKVRVYPFRGNPAKDWLKINGDEKRIFVYLYKLPTGVNDGEVSVSSGLTNPVGSVFYKKAVYDPKNPSSVDQYFSLPRNQNSVGKYLFVYGGDMTGANNSESGIAKYIQSGGTQGCVRTFEFDVDSALLSFDSNTYKGYRCEDNTGEIRLKAINGMGSIGTYTYELYDVKDGTRIDTKTAPKGTEVVFNSLGTFAAGQSTRWVKITDSECAAAHVWKELPVAKASQSNLLLKNPLNAAYCKGERLVIELQSVGATKYLWTLPDGSIQDTGTTPKLVIPSVQESHSGTYSVKAEGLTCGADTLTFSYKVNILNAPTAGQTYTLCQGASISDLKAKVDTNITKVRVYKNGVLVTNDSEVLTTTDTYTVSKFNATCETNQVGVTVALINIAQPTLTVTAATCTSVSVAKVSNRATYPAGTTFTITTAADAAVAGASVAADGTINGITAAGTYKVKATRGTCTSEANFTIDAALPVPVAPIVTLTPASCTSLTVAKISNYVSGQTYWNGTTQLTVNATTHEITGLGVGTYTITAKNIGCESAASSSFEIKAKQATTTTTNPVGAIYAKDAIAVPLTVTATGEGVLSYQWFEATSPTAPGTAVGSNSPSYTPSTSTIGSKFYYVEVTGSCGTVRSAVAKIKVPSVIDAADDTEVSVPQTGGTVSILTNDTLNGTPATPSNVTLTIDNNGGLTGLTVDSTGKLVVPNNTTPGTYTITYKICDKADANVCDTATAKIKVPSVIDANDDPDTTVGGGGIVDILSNDRLNGNPVTPTDVAITIPNDGGLTGLTVDNATGKLKVPTNATPGTYEVTYKICAVGGTTTCDTAKVKITVTVATPTITATPDTFTITTGTSTSSVIDNDRIGTATTTTGTVTIGVVTGATPKTPGANTPTLNPTDGTITVPNNTPAGTYSIVYQICEKLNPGNCATTTAVVTVATPTITATPDTFTITTGTSTSSVIDNDRIGTATTTTGTVTIGVVTGATPKTPGANTPSLNPTDGTITVPNNTPAGTYSIVYQICEKLNPGNCATSTVVVIVATPTITATPDTFTITTGTSTSSVIDNDRIGTATTTTGTVTIGVVTGATPKTPGANTPTLNPTDGTITVPNNTPAGTYSIVYQICEKLNPGNCSTATIVVTVVGTPTTAPIAVDDRATTPRNTPVTIDVLSNDTPNGATLPNVVTPPLNGSVIVNADGSIEYTPHTGFVGVDTFVYELCNAGGCATATVRVDVTNKLIVYNGISVGGDKNNHFHIAGIESYPNNTVRIYNRWGVKVWEVQSYDNVRNVFKGISNGRVTVEAAEKLPQGTYYYVIEYVDENNQQQSMVGWLYLKKN